MGSASREEGSCSGTGTSCWEFSTISRVKGIVHYGASEWGKLRQAAPEDIRAMFFKRVFCFCFTTTYHYSSEK